MKPSATRRPLPRMQPRLYEFTHSHAFQTRSQIFHSRYGSILRHLWASSRSELTRTRANCSLEMHYASLVDKAAETETRMLKVNCILFIHNWIFPNFINFPIRLYATPICRAPRSVMTKAIYNLRHWVKVYPSELYSFTVHTRNLDRWRALWRI